MNWVDYTRDDVWSVADLKGRARTILASEFDDAADLQVKAAQLAVGSGFMTAAERSRFDAYTSRVAELASQVETEWGRMGFLSQAMAVERAQRGLFYTYPALPPEDPDYLERQQQRTALQAVVDAASSDLMTLVTQRARVQPPEEVPQ